MRGFRITVLMLLFCCIGVALAGIRIEQVRCIARIQRYQLKRLVLKRKLHQRQLQTARLRSPDQIIGRIERLQLQVHAPEEIEKIVETNHRQEYALAAD